MSFKDCRKLDFHKARATVIVVTPLKKVDEKMSIVAIEKNTVLVVDFYRRIGAKNA